MNKIHRLLIHKKRAYTLVEILVVIAVIGIIAGITFPLLSRMKRASQKATAAREIAEIVNAIRSYQATYNRLPVPRETAGQLSEPVPVMSYGLTNTVQMKGMPLTYGKNTDVISALQRFRLAHEGR